MGGVPRDRRLVGAATSGRLAEFFDLSPRQSAGLTGREGLHGRVDDILNELEVPATVDADGDWRLETDVGPFLLVVDKVKDDLVAIQTIRNMEDGVGRYVEDMHVLLLLNLEAEGARFAALSDVDTDVLVLTARLRPDEVSRDKVETMLHDSMRLSRRLDELVTGAPPPGE